MGATSGLFRVKNWEARQRRNFTENLVGRDKSLNQSLGSQPKCDGQLHCVERAEASIKRVSFDQPLSQCEFFFAHRKDFQRSGNKVISKLAQKNPSVIAAE